MLAGISEDQFWKLIDEMTRENIENKGGDIPPPIKDRRKRFQTRSDYKEILEEAKKISLKGFPCKDLKCSGNLDESGKCNRCGMVVKSLEELPYF